MYLFYRIYILIFLIFCYFSNSCYPQSAGLRQINGLPSAQVYDLLTDSKGFLWIAHEAGLSKYDGVGFTNYPHPEQSSLSATGLLEDRYGRIWFNNFTGQIFYIEKGRVFLLHGYQTKGENDFPRIGLFKDLLVATTNKGLFVCDTRTMACHYETCKNALGKGTKSLSVLSNKVIACGYGSFFIYKPETGLKMIDFNDKEGEVITDNASTLTARTYNDTAFLFSNPVNILYKLKSDDDYSIKICSKQKLDNFINTVTVQKKGYWVNTVKNSYYNPGNKKITDVNISSVATDLDGRNWYGSLRKGLLTDTSNTYKFNTACSIPLLKGDVINCLIHFNDVLLIGTLNGKLISYNAKTKQSSLLVALPLNHGGINYLKALNSTEVLIGSSVNTYTFNVPKKSISLISPVKSIKQADTIYNSKIFATPRGLIAMQKDNDSTKFNAWKTTFIKHFKGTSERHDGGCRYLIYDQRAKGFCCLNNTIWVAFKNGLCSIDNRGVKPCYLKNKAIYASSLAKYNNALIVGTINTGVLVIRGKNLKYLTIDDGLLSNSVVNIKVIGDDLWVYNNGLVQVFDLKTMKMVTNYQLPVVGDAITSAVDQVKGEYYLGNENGLFHIARLKGTETSNKVYVASITVNGRDTDVVNRLILTYKQNDMLIGLGIPALLNGRDIVVKYRLKTGGVSKWAYSKPGERNFRFESLMPGDYLFEALAGRPQSGVKKQSVRLAFSILPPWWQRWWAQAAFALLATLLIFGISRMYYLSLLSAQKAEFEKELAIERERQRISSEIHDDIGGGLSAIKLYAGVGMKNSSATERDRLYGMVNELSDKIKEVIWSLNADNDGLENLIYFIEATAHKLFEHSDVTMRVAVPETIAAINIKGTNRRELYLAVKEALHNIIKHAQASNATISFNITTRVLNITITDDGIGLANGIKNKATGMGLKNIKTRMDKLGGKFSIESGSGTIVKLEMPV